MFDLFEVYLLIMILLLVGNIGLFLPDFKLSKIKYILTAIFLSILILILIFVSGIFKLNLLFLKENMGWLFIIIAIILFIIDYIYLKNKSYLKISTIFIIVILFVSTFLISAQFESIRLLYSVLFFALSFILFLVLRPVSELLHYAKRDYAIIVGEFMSLEVILIFIFGLTFWSVMGLNYGMFSSFLILTPTYVLSYLVIGIIFILILGIYYNDKKLKKR